MKSTMDWAQDAIMKECGYIVNCSFTEHAANNGAVTAESDAYGCFNKVRIGTKGPDWVVPEGGAVGAVGLMRGVIELKKRGHDIAEFDQVLRAFFWSWATGRALQNAQCEDSRNPDCGVWAVEVFHARLGKDGDGIKMIETSTPTLKALFMLSPSPCGGDRGTMAVDPDSERQQ
jgi:hypothetical protein